MLKIHKTRAGEQFFVSQMEDEHLRNTIELYLGQLKQLKGALEAKVTLNPFKSALYNVDVGAISEKAKGLINGVANKLYPYLAEAMLRGIDYKTELQTTFERTGAEEKFIIDTGNRTLSYDVSTSNYND